jgi:hypothetical protein
LYDLHVNFEWVEIFVERREERKTVWEESSSPMNLNCGGIDRFVMVWFGQKQGGGSERRYWHACVERVGGGI